MQHSAWEALLRHIPAELQNQYMVVTSSKTEITVQNFLRVEKEVLIFKGRLAGSQDQGLLFFIPFANIDYIGTTKAVKDSEFEEVFGSLKFPVQPANAPEPPPPPVNSAADRTLMGGRAASTDSGDRPAIRSEVLDRFRSRGGSSG